MTLGGRADVGGKIIAAAGREMSRILELFLLPPALVAIGMLICIAALMRSPRPRFAREAAIVTFMMYYAFATWPAAALMLESLEGQVRVAGEIDPRDVQAIVILAGAATSGDGALRRGELNLASWRRLWCGLEKYEELKGQVPIIFSGGGDNDPTNALVLRSAERFGVPATQFWVENASRTTRESGAAVKQLLTSRFPGERQHRIALVTSAWHMPRALGVFQRSSVATIPVPCDWRLYSESFGIYWLVPTYEALSASSFTLREWIGIAAYKLAGP